jgi:hypothetical protein
MEGLTPGRMVHYVMPDGQHRPATVVHVWDVSGVCEGYINLQVFTDGRNDAQQFSGRDIEAEVQVGSGVWWRTSICYSEQKEPGTWHWIEQA